MVRVEIWLTVRVEICHESELTVNQIHNTLWSNTSVNRHNCRCSNIKNMQASLKFRSEASYNNVIYSLAGHAIEQLGGAGKSWESLVRELVLDPLNMTQTSFYHDRDEPHSFAQPYLHPHGVALPWIQPPALPLVSHACHLHYSKQCLYI